MRRAKVIQTIEDMPPLDHWPNRPKPFRYEDSAVVNWLISQPDVLQWLFEHVRSNGHIVFDREDSKWKGARHR